MRNIKIILQYEGTRYQGWQRQESTENTIQGKLEAILTKMCGSKVEVDGAGRTDAGVHALRQTANFHTNSTLTTDEILQYLNTYLPEDIAVMRVKDVHERYHSRLNAKGKVYCYRVLNSRIPNVFDRRYVYRIPEPLDISAMEQAAAILCGTHDFKAFTSAKKGKKSTVRTVESITVRQEGGEIHFTFCGDGFLYHMVRIMMGTILEVGLHKREADGIKELLEYGKREAAGMLVPAAGLTLMEVRY